MTLPLSILAVTAAVLLFTGGIPAGDFGGVERLAVFPMRCWMVIAGIFLLSLKAEGRQFDPAPDHQISNALSWANARNRHLRLPL